MARKKIDVQVNAYHPTGATTEIDKVSDVTGLRIKLPGLDWVYRIDIDVDAKTGEVSLQVTPNVGDDKVDETNHPRLLVRPNGMFSVRS